MILLQPKLKSALADHKSFGFSRKQFNLIPQDLSLKFTVIVNTESGQFTKSTPIEIIGEIIHPLEGPEDFVWQRIGPSPATGLGEFGLQWQQNTVNQIVIQPLDDAKLVELKVEDWNLITTKEELAMAVETGTGLTKWEVIPTKVTFNYVIATKTAEGKYFLLNPTERTINPSDPGDRTVTGKYKYQNS